MSRQIAGLRKPFVADFAQKLFLSSVDALMFGQTGGICKSFATHTAYKWFLSRVSAFMFRQIARFCKRFITFGNLTLTNPMTILC